MNLKKSPGGSAADNATLASIAKEDREYLNQQFSLYNPDLVVCCGSVTSEVFHSVMELDSPPDWKTTTRGVWFHEYEPKKYIVEYSHPQARVQGYLLYYGLVDAVREIFTNRS
jgi:uracil-DNA glycosylase